MILKKFKVSGHSMEPYLKEGDQVLALRYLPVREKDVVVFKYNSKYLIKRISKVVKLEVEVEGDNKEYFVVGDNKKDSLNVNPIQKKDIIGKVILKL